MSSLKISDLKCNNILSNFQCKTFVNTFCHTCDLKIINNEILLDPEDCIQQRHYLIKENEECYICLNSYMIPKINYNEYSNSTSVDLSDLSDASNLSNYSTEYSE